MTNHSKGKSVLYYLAVVLASVAISILVLRLWESDLAAPFQYSGDALFYLSVVKGLLGNGWILHNKFVGMPAVQALPVDFPTVLVEVVPFFVMKLIGAFAHSAPLTVNIYFLLTFPLIALCSMICFRQMDLDYGSCAVGSLLYAFLPYHMKGQYHLVMASYYVVPLAVMISLWVYRGQAILIEASEAERLRMNVKGYRQVMSIGVCIVIAATQEYYAFFACFFLLIAGTLGSIRRRTVSHICAALFLIAVISVTFFAALSPAILSAYKNGKNTEVAARLPAEAEIYGLKITQMLLPVTGHRLHALNDTRQRYNKQAPLVNENDYATLGVVGSVGFLSLILWPLLRRNFINSVENSPASIADLLSIMTIYAVLLATIGGFSSLFALTVSPMLRCYNRISVYIAFFSLASVLLLVASVFRRYKESWRTKVIWSVSLVILLVVGLLDEIPQDVSRYFHGTKVEYASDAEFVSQIEASLPPSAMIFQLPYFSFPEHRPVHNMSDYAHFKGYVHSKSLRWSYGAVRGRVADLWQKKNVVQKTIEEAVENLAAAGFAGIYVDLYGYPNGSTEIREKLVKMLNGQPMESPNKRLLFFDLREYARRLEVAYGACEWDKKRHLMKAHPLSPPLGEEVTFSGESGTGLELLGTGFSQPEKTFTWTSAKEASLRVAIPATAGDVEMTLRAIPFEPASWQKRRYVDVFCDETQVARWPLLPNGQGMSPTEYKARINKSLVKPGQVQKISFRFSDTISPKMLGISEDPRLLGLAFTSMVFRELPCD